MLEEPYRRAEPCTLEELVGSLGTEAVESDPRIGLVHSHLPALRDTGLAETDAETGTVALTTAARALLVETGANRPVLRTEPRLDATELE